MNIASVVRVGKYFFGKVTQVFDDKHDTLNILLIGQTGVGKSTFINAFANYVLYPDYETAKRNQTRVIIPVKISDIDEVTYEEKFVLIGQDENERSALGSSSTISTQSYTFKTADGQKIRLIDTPGAGDSEGIEKDGEKVKDIISYISNLKYLHGICFLLHPNQTVIDPYFKFCLEHLLSHLDKSAANNIIFIFTRCQKPGSTLSLLRQELAAIKSQPPHTNIPTDPNNIFCVENEPFQCLMKFKEGIDVSQYDLQRMNDLWKFSFESNKKLITRIKSLAPHVTNSTVALEEARFIIFAMNMPLKTITETIQTAIQNLENNQEELKQSDASSDILKSKLTFTRTNLKIIQLPNAICVCTNSGCVEKITVNGVTKSNYKQICHDPCHLQDSTIQLWGLEGAMFWCKAMGWTGNCKKCECEYNAHNRIAYKTETYEEKVEDPNVKMNLSTEEGRADALKNSMKLLNDCVKIHRDELNKIMDALVTFHYYLQHNSLKPMGDAYLSYLTFSLEREKKKATPNVDLANQLQDSIQQYNMLKQKLERNIQDGTTPPAHKDVIQTKEYLFSLSKNGDLIKQMYEIQEREMKNNRRLPREHDCTQI